MDEVVECLTYSGVLAGEVVKLMKTKYTCCSEVSARISILKTKLLPKLVLEMRSLQ